MRRLRVAVMAIALILVPHAALAASEVTVSDLIEMGADLAGQEVAVSGELIGDYGHRDDGWTWTQLNGDAYVYEPIVEGGPPVGANQGIGIRMPTALTDSLDDPGGYHSRGPIVRVAGIWKYHDPERQGESYLEVESLTVLEKGRSLNEGPDWFAITIGTLLGTAAVAAWVTRPTTNAVGRGNRDRRKTSTHRSPDSRACGVSTERPGNGEPPS